MLVAVNGAVLKRALERVRHARSRRLDRPVLGTVFFQVVEEGKLRLVAADNYRLAVAEVPVRTDGTTFGGKFSLHGEDLTVLAMFLRGRGYAEVTVDAPEAADRVSFRVPAGTLELRKFDGEWPDYEAKVIERVAAAEPGTTAMVALKYLREAGGPPRRGDGAGHVVRVTVREGTELPIVLEDPGYRDDVTFREYVMPVRSFDFDKSGGS